MTRTILLADDSVTIQKVVELTFLDEDFRVVAFGNGTDAMTRLAETQPDIVLADVHMPGADGYEVCSAVKQAAPSTPVLLLVGTFELFDADRAAEVGAAGHMKKPFDSQELLRRVKELLEGASESAQPIADPEPSWSMPLGATVDTASPTEPQPEPAGDAGDGAAGGSSWGFEPVEEEVAAPEQADESTPEVAPEVAEAPLEALPRIDTSASFDVLSGADVDVTVPASMTEVAFTEPPAVEPAGAGEEAGPEAAATSAQAGPLSEDDVDRIARRVVELLGDRPIREVAWEVVPDLAEVLLKARIRELEASVE